MKEVLAQLTRQAGAERVETVGRPAYEDAESPAETAGQVVQIG